MIQINSDLLSQLLPNVITIVTQLLATLVLCFLMYKLAYKPVKKILDTRADFEQAKLTEAEKVKAESEEIRSQLNAELGKIDAKAEEIISSAKAEGQKIKEDLIKEGKEKSRALIVEASEEVELKKKQMVDEMHQQIVDVALNVTEKMLNNNIYNKDDSDIIDSFIKEVNGK